MLFFTNTQLHRHTLFETINGCRGYHVQFILQWIYWLWISLQIGKVSLSLQVAPHRLQCICNVKLVSFFGRNACLLWSSYKLHIWNPVQINNREWLHIKFGKICNAIFEKKLHKKIKSTNIQCTMKPKFRQNNEKYVISSNMLIFDSYAIIKLSMQSTSVITPLLFMCYLFVKSWEGVCLKIFRLLVSTILNKIFYLSLSKHAESIL